MTLEELTDKLTATLRLQQYNIDQLRISNPYTLATYIMMMEHLLDYIDNDSVRDLCNKIK